MGDGREATKNIMSGDKDIIWSPENSAPGELPSIRDFAAALGRTPQPPYPLFAKLLAAFTFTTTTTVFLAAAYLWLDAGVHPNRANLSAMLSLMAGGGAAITVILCRPRRWQEGLAACLAGLVSGFLFVGAVIGTGETVRFFGLEDWPEYAFVLPIVLVAVAPTIAVTFGAAWLLGGRALMVDSAGARATTPEPFGLVQFLQLMAIMAVAYVTAVALGVLGFMLRPAECGPVLGGAFAGAFMVAHCGATLLRVWPRAKGLRRELAARAAVAVLVVPALFPLEPLIGCWDGKQAWEGGWFLITILGMGFPVFLAGAILGAWQLGRFVNRHGLMPPTGGTGESAG